VQEARIRGIAIPRGMIPVLISRIDKAPREPGVGDSSFPLPLPQYVGDIRVANGKVTLYKNVQ
jgi:hypothetical protein